MLLRHAQLIKEVLISLVVSSPSQSFTNQALLYMKADNNTLQLIRTLEFFLQCKKNELAKFVWKCVYTYYTKGYNNQTFFLLGQWTTVFFQSFFNKILV
jgi:hypothetical protein